MSGPSRLSNGLALLRFTAGVIRDNPKLLLFPLASAVATVALGLLVAAPVVLRPTGHAYSDPMHWNAVGRRLAFERPATEEQKAAGRKDGDVRFAGQTYALFFLFYCLATFTAAFFSVGFAHEIFDALDGNNVSVLEGLQFAFSRAGTILKWTLFSSFVGTVIKALENNAGFVGKWVMRAVGLAWAAASVFAVPALAAAEDQPGPVALVKRSADLIRKSWGEALTGYAGLQAGAILGSLPAFAFLGLGGIVGVREGAFTPFFIGVAACFAWMIAQSYLMGVANQVYLCVLYRYAATGKVPEGLSVEMLDGAWTRKTLYKPS